MKYNFFPEVVVLESTGRVGGRMREEPFADGRVWVEAGAQWVHGVEGNVAYELGSGMGLLDDPEQEVICCCNCCCG